MNKVLCIILMVIFVFFTGCTQKDVLDSTDNANSVPDSSSSQANETLTQVPTQNPDEATTDYFVEPVEAPTQKGCFYGKNTGTDKTYTGLESLPLTDFPTADFNSNGLSTALKEHSYGVASNEEPHEISKQNQKYFDEKGFDALALDTKSQDKVLYLTFDCGYENGYTARILDVLKEKNVPAAFFCTKPEMEQNPDIIARMINEGHIVGNHSVTHPDFSGLTRQEMYEEVKGFDDYIREKFGYSSLYFRYPQGKYSEDSLDFLNSMGFECVFWSLAYADWDLSNQKGADYALDTVISRIHPGAVMLLHAVSPDNALALGDIIDTARDMGYEFKALNER